VTALSVLEAANAGVKEKGESRPKRVFKLLVVAFHIIILMNTGILHPQELSYLITPFDLKRLEQYANNMLDYHVILDLLPILADLYFQQRLCASEEGEEDVQFTGLQSAIFLAVGLQRKTIEEVEVRHRLSYQPSCLSSVYANVTFVARVLGGTVVTSIANFGIICESDQEDEQKTG